jgi:hypothetical protein
MRRGCTSGSPFLGTLAARLVLVRECELLSSFPQRQDKPRKQKSERTIHTNGTQFPILRPRRRRLKAPPQTKAKTKAKSCNQATSA